jgi:hypothetical protein
MLIRRDAMLGVSFANGVSFVNNVSFVKTASLSQMQTTAQHKLQTELYQKKRDAMLGVSTVCVMLFIY